MFPLLAWIQQLLLDRDLSGPKTLRCRLLHIDARITRSARRTRVRIAEHWPWIDQVVTPFSRLAVLPQPTT